MTDREVDRRAAHRLMVIRHAQEVTGNVSKPCRYAFDRPHGGLRDGQTPLRDCARR